MKSQTLFSLKDKSKKLKCHLLQFLFGTLGLSLEKEFSQDKKGPLVKIVTVYIVAKNELKFNCNRILKFLVF